MSKRQLYLVGTCLYVLIGSTLSAQLVPENLPILNISNDGNCILNSLDICNPHIICIHELDDAAYHLPVIGKRQLSFSSY